jgi:O-antigen/teichoic acid export membrane protein
MNGKGGGAPLQRSSLPGQPEGAAPQAPATPAGPAGFDFRRLRRGGLTFGASQVTGMILGFLGSLLMVRIAPKVDVASYNQLLQAIMAVGMVLQLGLVPAALRFVPVSRGEGGGRATALLRRRLFAIQATLWVVAIPILALVWPALVRRLDAPELAGAFPFLAAAVILASLGQVADGYLRAFRRYSASALLGHLAPRAMIAGGFLFLALSFSNNVPWEMLASVYLASLIVTVFGYAAALWRTTPGEVSEPRLAHEPPRIPQILATTSAMGLRSAAAVLFVASDLWVLDWARPNEEVAVYVIAGSLLQVLSAVPAMANAVLPQEFSLLYAEGRTDEIERLARTSATIVATLSLACLLGLLLFGRPLIRLAYGEAYAGAWGLLLILALGSFWDAASGGAGYVLQMTGHHVRLLVLSLGGAAANILLSLALAPRWGGYGVACATALTLIAINLAMVASVRRLLGVRTFVYLQPTQWLHALRLAGRSSGEGANSK